MAAASLRVVVATTAREQLMWVAADGGECRLAHMTENSVSPGCISMYQVGILTHVFSTLPVIAVEPFSIVPVGNQIAESERPTVEDFDTALGH
jgi:hypothetical protein